MQFSKLFLLFLLPVFINGSTYLRMKFSTNKRCFIDVETFTEEQEFLLSAHLPLFPGTPTYQAIYYCENFSYKFRITDMITGEYIGQTWPHRLKLENEIINLSFKDFNLVGANTTVKIETNVDCPE
ncbi:unnamed protein product [Caenorhabditis angaria]|uniref:Uncharacterized protein n=1 Tax=Caenorhabditis angaria TaxID=860376 RepID=A0A9P1MSH7_9PELO|nr:unnamed protein product [Caenorhabditis angaria]